MGTGAGKAARNYGHRLRWSQESTHSRIFHVPGTGRIFFSRKLPLSIQTAGWVPDSTARHYAAGTPGPPPLTSVDSV